MGVYLFRLPHNLGTLRLTSEPSRAFVAIASLGHSSVDWLARLVQLFFSRLAPTFILSLVTKPQSDQEQPVRPKTKSNDGDSDNGHWNLIHPLSTRK